MAGDEWRDSEVCAVRDLSHDIRMIEILSSGKFEPAASGAHLKVLVTIGGRVDTRSYSIFEATSGGRYRIAVKRLEQSRGGSAFMSSLEAGARLTIAGPQNDFPLTPGRTEYLLVAGGIGITPIYSHALALKRLRADFRVAYGAHRREDLALAGELEAAIGDRLRLFASDAGLRIDLAGEFARLSDDGEAYVCGPIGMLEAAKRAWRDAGRRTDRLRFETFGASGAWPPSEFRVKIPRLAKDILVPPTMTMLDALEAAGVEMISDCRKGECGLCALPVLAVDGVIDHRDVFFTDEEKASNAKVCACVSRVHGGSVTLDTADR